MIEMGKQNKLTPRQAKFVRNLLKGMSQTKAYSAAGYKPKDDDVAATEAARLFGNVQVKRYYERQLEDIVAKVKDRLMLLSQEATDTLEELNKKSTKNDSVRVSAANSILDRAGVKSKQEVDIELSEMVIRFEDVTTSNNSQKES